MDIKTVLKWFKIAGTVFSPVAVARNRKQAIEKSLSKWVLLSLGLNTGHDDIETCGLCEMYFNHGDCRYCPISKHTGHHQCNKTPFREWEGCPIIANAKKELRFLRRLFTHKEA